MADEGPKGNPATLALQLFGFLALVILGWFMFGGWKNADLRSYFLTPPSGPQINVSPSGGIIQGSTTTPPTYPDAEEPPRL